MNINNNSNNIRKINKSKIYNKSKSNNLKNKYNKMKIIINKHMKIINNNYKTKNKFIKSNRNNYKIS